MNVFHPSYSSSAQQGSLHVAFPVALPGSPLASVVISHDLQAKVGISVLIDIEGLGDHQERVSALQRGAEEFLRRGGGLRVVRWIWEHSKSLLIAS